MEMINKQIRSLFTSDKMDFKYKTLHNTKTLYNDKRTNSPKRYKKYKYASNLMVVVVYLLSHVRLLQLHGLQPIRLLCPWDSPGKNTGVGCHFLLQGIFPNQDSNLGLLHCRQVFYLIAPKYMKQTSTDQKKEADYNKITVGDFSILLSILDRACKISIKKQGI